MDKNVATITEDLHDIEVINDNIVLAYGYGTGSIYKTINDGKSWDKIHQFDSIYFEQIQFLDEQNGWLVGSPNKIYKTENGGRTWLNKSLKHESIDCYIYGMYFEEINHGYIAALENSKSGFSTKIFKTTDGGNTWELINTIEEMLLNLEKIDGTIYATGNNVIVKDIHLKENWKYCFQDKNSQVGQIRDIEQNTAKKIFASSFNGYLIELIEENSQLHKITNNRLRSLTSVDKNQWIATGDNNKNAGNLFISIDNGKNWKPVEKEFQDIHRIEKSKKKLWLVGKGGLIISRKK